MAEMPVTTRTVDFGAGHEKLAIHALFDRIGGQGREKRRPTGAAFEFFVGMKQFRPATHTGIGPVGGWLHIVASGAFGAVFARHLIGEIGQLRAPFRVGFGDFCHIFPLFMSRDP